MTYNKLQAAPAGVILEPIPAALVVVVEAVLGDLLEPGTRSVEIGYAAAAFGEQPYLFLRLDAAGGLVGIDVSTEDQGYLTVRIAESVQTALAESGGGWAEPRPQCFPGHAHPPEPQLWEGAPSWVCPRELRRVSLIGDA
jgi:hypothetical protein